MEPNDNRYSAELTSPAKPAAEENRDLASQVYALAMVVVEQKSREQVYGKVCRDLEDTLVRERSELSSTVHMCRDVEESLTRKRSETQRPCNVIDYVSARQIDNADLISALRENITDQREEIRRLEELVDSQNIDIDKLQSQIRYLQASRPVEKTAGKRDNYLSDDNKSLFSNSDDDGST